MKYIMPSNRIKLVLVVLLVILGLGSFAYNQYLVNKILNKERYSVELWAKAIEYNWKPKYPSLRRSMISMAEEMENSSRLPDSLQTQWSQLVKTAETELANASLDFVASELIIKNRFEIPSMVVNEEGEILHSRNISERELGPELIKEFKEMNPPIRIRVGTDENSSYQMLYYGESSTVRLLRYFPYIQFALLALLLGIGYTSYSSIRKTEQSNLWVGMAKEAAHQLGTPVSSLYGWIALMKDQNSDEETLQIAHELENDVKRLQGVAERFNKIGSAPELQAKRIEPVLGKVMDYMERRIPQVGSKIQLQRDFSTNVRIAVNEELFQWSIENLVKNAIDALKQSENGQQNGWVKLKVHHQEQRVFIDVIDNGCGIPKKYQHDIFKPGFSTKKRGWGLGLSLTRRIIEDYHKGKIYVHESSAATGTTIRIELAQVLAEKGNGKFKESNSGAA